MKIPFDIKYKDDILAGRVKVQTTDGKDVRIISFDGPAVFPVVGVVKDEFGEGLYDWKMNGSFTYRKSESCLNLVIIKCE